MMCLCVCERVFSEVLMKKRERRKENKRQREKERENLLNFCVRERKGMLGEKSFWLG